MINEVFSDEQRDRLVDTVSGALAGIRRDDILERAFEYWRNIDKSIGDRIAALATDKRSVGAVEKGGGRFD
jgi:catalase